MADALTPEQINLLRGLPGQLSELKKSPDAERLFLAGLLTRIGSPEYSTVVRTRAADLLLATIDRLSSQSPEGGLAAAEAVECLADKYSGATETVTVYRTQIVAELRDLAKSLAANPNETDENLDQEQAVQARSPEAEHLRKIADQIIDAAEQIEVLADHFANPAPTEGGQ